MAKRPQQTKGLPKDDRFTPIRLEKAVSRNSMVVAQAIGRAPRARPFRDRSKYDRKRNGTSSQRETRE